MAGAEPGTNAYRPGGVYGLCDRCSFQFRLKSLRKEWTGMMVCSKCFDEKPAELTPPVVRPEGVPVKDARPDNQQDNTPNLTQPSDL